MSIEMPHTALEDLLTKHKDLVAREKSGDLSIDIFSDPNCLTLNGQTIRGLRFQDFDLRATQFLNCTFVDCIFDNNLERTLFYNNVFVDCISFFRSISSCFSGNVHHGGRFQLQGTSGVDNMTCLGVKVDLAVEDSTLCNIDLDEGSLVLNLTQSVLFNLKHRNLSRFHVDLDAESLFM